MKKLVKTLPLRRRLGIRLIAIQAAGLRIISLRPGRLLCVMKRNLLISNYFSPCDRTDYEGLYFRGAAASRSVNESVL